jgi:AcrR family transcriptional regulator
MSATAIIYHRPVGRWQPNARDRLAGAALELYGERGFEQTTVADIAARAGLTERTFFRHFADKREVLFAGSERLQQLMVGGLAAAPVGATPVDAVAAALDTATGFFDQGRQDYARRRQGVIVANTELRERELIKMATLAAALVQGLRDRGVPDPAASLAAEAGIAVFRVAFERWVAEGETRTLAELIADSLDQLRTVTAAGRPRRARATRR